jgi:ribosome-binding ATPase YchF (GTP1/OBG family)
VLARCLDALGAERPVRALVWPEADAAAAHAVVRDLGLLTAKPVVWVANIDENQMTRLMLHNETVTGTSPTHAHTQRRTHAHVCA